ncbi:hypothetical protein F5Y15DRAFT_401863 [Xylariaceae sp. FL0016]|nr:hypothetical protein F5Y15DRAFT_401863 [Xylariaceae sp. FL0016]
MEAASPPKRMTRARAAAKGAAAAASSASVRSTKVATATTTKSTTTSATTITRKTSTKRKTRSDEAEDEDPLSVGPDPSTAMNKPATRTRGKAKKVAESDPEPQTDNEYNLSGALAPNSAKPTRGRPRKTASSTPTTTVTKQEPAKTTRTRIRKTTANTDNTDAPAEPVKKTTRGRAASNAKTAAGTVATACFTEPTPGLKSNISRPASRIGSIVKKSVSFQEPEKENVVPATAAGKSKGKTTETSATGMRARPVRKPAVAGRTTRAAARAATIEDKKGPLSPKKDGQNRDLSRDGSSDDELATFEKTPLKPLMKSPVKPPSTKRFELPPPTKEDGNDATQMSEPPTSTVFGSPARRPQASPFKDAMKSPAKKVESVPSLMYTSDKSEKEPESSSSKVPLLLNSPAKRPQMPIKSLHPPAQDHSSLPRSPVKMSLFGSPAKRPTSPAKKNGSLGSREEKSEDLGGAKTSVEQAHKMENPQTGATDDQALVDTEYRSRIEENGKEDMTGDEIHLESPTELTFPGRLSAVLPRHADPALRENPLLAPRQHIEPTEPLVAQGPGDKDFEEMKGPKTEEQLDDPMEVDEVEPGQPKATVDAEAEVIQASRPLSPLKRMLNPAFGLRAKDLDDQYASESEDELAASGRKFSAHQDDTTLTFNGAGVPATPTPFSFGSSRDSIPSSAVKAANRAIRSVSKGAKIGFTPLATQLGEWKTSSPLKLGKVVQMPLPTQQNEDEEFSLLSDKDFPAIEVSPSKGFFEDEMRVRTQIDNQAAMEALLEAEFAARYDNTDLEPEFQDMAITNEDIELANEAEEMSTLEPEEALETGSGQGHDDSISDASQEYGDENAVPIDPALLEGRAAVRGLSVIPTTPIRPSTQRSFHTISKVPLKPADDSAPKSVRRRCASVSKVSTQRPTGALARNATVISYSATKSSGTFTMDVDMSSDEEDCENPPVTPAKPDLWSCAGTPARTPRRDLDPGALRGAVIYLDVHTTNGEDAKGVFSDLLQSLGARVVKSWPWNPRNTGAHAESITSKVGITHVVYKDGSKRVLEKVRATDGIVQCVGVSWALE